MERHLATVWESLADAIGDAVALVQGERQILWRDYDERAGRLATAFAEAGLAAGSKVALYLYNAPAYCETYYAALKLRAVPVNVNYRYLDDELLHLLEDSEAEALVFHASLGDRVERVRVRARALRMLVEVDDGGTSTVATALAYEDVLAAHAPAKRIARSPDDATMLYTGGTTGLPKGVLGRVGNVVDTAMTAVPPLLGSAPLDDPAKIASVVRSGCDAGRQIVSLPACPLMHGTGMGIGVLPAMTFGSRTVLLAGRGLDVDEVWSTVERHRVRSLTIVGDAFARPLLRGLREGPPRDLDALQLVLSAGAMFSTEVKQGLFEYARNLTIIDYIAASEGAMGASISTRASPAPTGHFRPGPNVKVFREDGGEIAPGSGEMGMVGVSGAIPDGYYRDEAKTAKTFRTVDGVRYSFPGDWATVEADGSLVLLGRGSQCINTGGEKVFPEEVEEAVKRHPAVDDCLIFGVPDERFGQRVVGVVSLAPGVEADADAVIASLRERIATYKVPRRLVAVSSVPRAANGKADYPAARELFEAAS
jgi:3-oxocholest-4-en-26-oate---CoA ligase